jgi:hypothetical protein
MLKCPGLKAASASGALALALAFAFAGVPTPVLATDIAWHSTTTLTYENGRNYRRDGTAVLKSGETAAFLGDGTAYAIDEKGMAPFKIQYMLRFEDGSTITLRSSGTRHQFDGTTSGSGDFINGTGRFDGITGSVRHTGQVSGSTAELDWAGSYTLPGK